MCIAWEGSHLPQRKLPIKFQLQLFNYSKPKYRERQPIYLFIYNKTNTDISEFNLLTDS